MDDIIKQLKQLKNIEPSENWKNQQRQILLSQITAQREFKKAPLAVNAWHLLKSALPSGVLNFVAKPVGVLTLIIAFVASSGILGVNASRGSVPGDLLYGFKLTGEKIQVGLTASQSKQAQLHVQFAQERVNEINKVLSAENSTSNKESQVQIAVAELKKDMQKAQDKLEEVKQEFNSDKSVVDSVRDINQKTSEINSAIDERKLELSGRNA